MNQTRARRTSRTIAAGVATLLAASLAAAVPGTPAAADPPSDLRCAGLALGSTGLPGLRDQIPSVDPNRGIGAISPASAKLPKDVVFEDGRHAISNAYAFALRRGTLHVRDADAGRAKKGSRWHRLTLPSCLQGAITSVSADHELLTVTTTDGQLYSHDMPGNDLSAQRWTWRWGPFLWLGAGMKMFPGVVDWSISSFNANETFTDSAGRRHHPIGVATGYLLRKDRRTITYIDPWLPVDESREMCGPRRGRLILASLDASGSTVLAAGTDGSLWTRLYDFDVSGANSMAGSYTWQRDVAPDSAAFQLPAPGWKRQPTPPGAVTDRVTIVKTGTDASDRELRVEGRNRKGRNGWWRKQIGASSWRFTASGRSLAGKVLKAHTELATSRDRRYVGSIAGAPAVVSNFNSACSGADLAVKLDGATLNLRLHSEDVLRQVERGPGLDDVPRQYNAAIEIPGTTWRNLSKAPPAVRSFVASHLDGQITEVPISVTATRLRMRYQCWEFTLDGAPARADRPADPLDVGLLLNAFKEVPAQGKLASC
ncbi:hypothetical protein ACLM5J_04275 [Nocardioides sp. Bht2]|uniref:hypothetical protein n=1 Tax=Nocardioides sp. Bht2 TaxID=3392297 RepID=UPI0039B5D240